MKLATVANGSRDGQLVVVSRDGARMLTPQPALTLQAVIENWEAELDQLMELARQLAQGTGDSTEGACFCAPLPRAWQWLDGSAFNSHGELMQVAYGLEPMENAKPLMYQGLSDQFYGPNDDVPFMRESDGIDFEGEFAVIVDEVPMGTTASDAMSHIKLVLQLNDWSLRALGPGEMKTGFGFVQTKPPCSVAPFAVTVDELGDRWSEGRVQLNLDVRWNDEHFGNAHGGAMSVGFHELVAHAAETRTLCAGTIIGSGTVSNSNYREVGSSCISERRGIEMVDEGEATTGFMRFGDSITMECRLPDGSSVFGRIDQKVVSGS